MTAQRDEPVPPLEERLAELAELLVAVDERIAAEDAAAATRTG